MTWPFQVNRTCCIGKTSFFKSSHGFCTINSRKNHMCAQKSTRNKVATGYNTARRKSLIIIRGLARFCAVLCYINHLHCTLYLTMISLCPVLRSFMDRATFVNHSDKAKSIALSNQSDISLIKHLPAYKRAFSILHGVWFYHFGRSLWWSRFRKY